MAEFKNKHLFVSTQNRYVEKYPLLETISRRGKIYNTVGNITNIYSKIQAAAFTHRQAVKLAEVDKLYNYRFSKAPRDEEDRAEITIFADLCGGPGGQIEYLLYRCGWRCRAFCVSHSSTGGQYKFNEYRYVDSFPVKEFQAVAVAGAAGAGADDPFNRYFYSAAVRSRFIETVMDGTQNVGVDNVFACGSSDSYKNLQHIREYYTLSLYAYQTQVALAILRENGSFILRMYSTLTVFSAELLYCLYMSFESINMEKLRTINQSSPEQYLVCLNRKSRNKTATIEKLLTELTDRLETANHLLNKPIVYFDRLMDDYYCSFLPKPSMDFTLNETFVKWLNATNDKSVCSEIEGMESMIAAFEEGRVADTKLQETTRDQFLREFNIPAKYPDTINADVTENFKNAQLYTPSQKRDHLTHVHFDGPAVVNRLYFKNSSSLAQYHKCTWTITDWDYKLPMGTILYGRIDENRVLCVIDAYSLGQDLVFVKAFDDRRRDLLRFCQIVNTINGCGTVIRALDYNKSDTLPKSGCRLYWPTDSKEWIELYDPNEHKNFYYNEQKNVRRWKRPSRDSCIYTFVDSMNHRCYRPIE